MIEARGITKAYRDGERVVPVLHGLDLDLAPGEFVAIMGASGSGKSTLLQILGCLDAADAGEYRLGGELVSHLSRDALAARRNRQLGFVFQAAHFVDYLDLVDNVALPAEYGPPVPPARVRERAMALLDKVGLGHRLDHHPAQLSGGERQRAAVARALYAAPAVLLADEPTGNLDAGNTAQLMALLQELHREGMGILLVTHDPAVAAMAQRRCELAGGGLQAVAA